MGRPRKPSAVLERNGSFKKHPDRKREREEEPKPTGPLGDAPPGFDAALEAIWLELAAAAPARVLGNSDRWLVEIACRLMGRLRSGEATNGELAMLVTCLSKMGMSPADRSKVGVPEDSGEKDGWSELAGEVMPKAAGGKKPRRVN